MSKSAYASLPPRRRKFVDAYVRLGVGTEAYLEVYPDAKRPDAGAAQMLGKPGVREAVAERTELAIARAGVRQVRVLEELAALAFADVGELFDENRRLKDFSAMTPRARASIAAIDCEELLEHVDGEARPVGVVRKLKTHPKAEALKLLLQYLRLLPERHEFSGPNGGPIETKDAGELSDLDRARRVAFLLAKGLALSQSEPDPGNPAGDSPPAQSNQQEINS